MSPMKRGGEPASHREGGGAVSVINGQKVTVGDSPLSGGEFQTGTVERETGGQASVTLHSPITLGDRWRGVLAGVKGWFSMLSPLAERAPAAEQLLEYARVAPWTGRRDGLVRFVGVAWCRLVAIPVIAGLRIAEWPFQRLSRFVFTAVTVKLCAELPPVRWVADHLIKPGVEYALWLFL